MSVGSPFPETVTAGRLLARGSRATAADRAAKDRRAAEVFMVLMRVDSPKKLVVVTSVCVQRLSWEISWKLERPKGYQLRSG